MVLMGAKTRFVKDILPIILKNRGDKPYFESCGGGMNVISNVDGERTAFEINKYLVAMWKSLQNGIVFCEEISRSHYSDVRDCYNKKDSKYNDDYIGWVGFMASANGRFFEGGYAGISKTKGGERNYIAEKIKNIKKQIPKIKDVNFICADFKEMTLKEESIIYCDPPYYGTKQYDKDNKDFDYPAYYKWCRKMVGLGHLVYMSEYQMPEDFNCIWEKETKSSLSANGKSGGNKKSTEKLFVHNSQLGLVT